MGLMKSTEKPSNFILTISFNHLLYLNFIRNHKNYLILLLSREESHFPSQPINKQCQEPKVNNKDKPKTNKWLLMNHAENTRWAIYTYIFLQIVLNIVSI